MLFETAALREAGGFAFWRDLPPLHCGADVLAQLRVMARRGGFGVMPSGVHHLELPTTLPCRRVNAPDLMTAGRSGTSAHGSEASQQIHQERDPR